MSTLMQLYEESGLKEKQEELERRYGNIISMREESAVD